MFKSRYNDNTFKIDDISWDDSPMCTFERRGEQITFREYYRQVIEALFSKTQEQI